MNLCLISSEYPPGPHGGSGTFTQVFARALQKSGHRVRVAGIYPAHYPGPNYGEDQGVQIWRLRERGYGGGWAVARLQLFRLIRRWIRDGELDLVEAPDHQGWFAGWPKLPVPLVQRAGGSYSYFAREMGTTVRRNLFRLEKWSYHRADSWIAKSQYSAKVTAEVFQLKSGPDAILYNPVEIPAVAQPFCERSRYRVVFSGTLAHKKGVIALIEAWPMVMGRIPGAELHLYGKDGKAETNGSMAVYCTSYLKRLLSPQLQSSVTFQGHLSRDVLFQVLSTARVGVFPSFSEGFAWAPLEAMAYGCPTIYTSLGSGRELISDGIDGLLVDPHHPNQVAEAIVKVLKSDSLAARLGEAGCRRVRQNFSLEKLLPLNETFYRDLIRSFNGKKI